MAMTIRKVDYFKVGVADKAGEGARLLGILKDAKVNLLALTGFPRGRRAQIDLVPQDATAFKKAMKKAGVALGGKKTLFLVQGEDRVGAVAEILDKLGAAGINVTAVDAVTDGKGRFGGILWVKPKDMAKACRILGVR